jgi:hypothetical protein
MTSRARFNAWVNYWWPGLCWPLAFVLALLLWFAT